MSGRRERVTITAHAATDGAPDVTVSGALDSFLVETRQSFGYNGRALDAGEVSVTIHMRLDPESARIFRDRNRPRRVHRLITAPERELRDRHQRAVRLVALLDGPLDGVTYYALSGGRWPHTHQLMARSPMTRDGSPSDNGSVVNG